MTETEKIKELLKLNKSTAAIVVDKDAYIHEINSFATKKFNSVKIGKSLYNIFDKNTTLLIKNNLIDAKVLNKIQRRKVNVITTIATELLQLIISPFTINGVKYFYILIFDENAEDNLLVYPTIDDSNIKLKYKQIFEQLEKVSHLTLIEKKNLQFSLDIEKLPIAIRDNNNYTFVNDSFAKFVQLQDDKILGKNHTQIFDLSLAEKLSCTEEVIRLTQNIIVIESTEYLPNDIQQKNRIVCTPISDDENITPMTIAFGEINAKRNEEKIEKTIELGSKNKSKEKGVSKSEKDFDSESGEAKIVYDKNTFKILKVNKSAATLYGYSLNKLQKMDITDLYSPEDMQKLLTPINDLNKNTDFTHVKNDGSEIIVKITSENLKWEKIEAIQNVIKLKEKEVKDEGTEGKNEIEKENKPEVEIESKQEEVVQENILEDDSNKTKKNEITPNANTSSNENISTKVKPDNILLSSLFHELLTPINVILGFVQEIVDSIDKPTEEQAESAEIIKNNKQLLLQTMNTAVQYAQMNEGIAKQKIEEFDFKNYLLDIQDSVSRISEKESVEVNFENISDKLILKNDRRKMLATISHFLKFAIKLTSSKKINISFIKDNNQFVVLVNDEDENTSEKLASEIIESYRIDNILEKNNPKISPITIKLARKLNEVTSGEVGRYNFDDKKYIALSFPVEAKYAEEDLEKTKVVDETIVPIEPKKDIVEEAKVDKVEISKIKDKANEDITDEKESDKEEITAIEKVGTEEETIVKPTRDRTELSKYSCLLIEDSIDSQLLFKTQMKDFKLLEVASGLTEALPLIQKYNFDLIYVDINLQGQYNGLDALKIIRQFENYKTTPIIAVTSYPFEGDKENFILAGFNDYFIKPLLKEQLLNSINLLAK